MEKKSIFISLPVWRFQKTAALRVSGRVSDPPAHPFNHMLANAFVFVGKLQQIARRDRLDSVGFPFLSFVYNICDNWQKKGPRGRVCLTLAWIELGYPMFPSKASLLPKTALQILNIGCFESTAHATRRVPSWFVASPFVVRHFHVSD